MAGVLCGVHGAGVGLGWRWNGVGDEMGMGWDGDFVLGTALRPVSGAGQH